MQTDQEALLPIPVSTEKRPDPRLALTIGVAGWIAEPKDFGKQAATFSFELQHACNMQTDHLAQRQILHMVLRASAVTR